MVLQAVERAPNGIRTRVATLKGWSPGPLDDGDCLAVGDVGEHTGPVAQALRTFGRWPLQSDLLGPLAQLAEQRTSNRSAWPETARMTPLKVGEPFACTLGMAIPSQAEGDLGRCRDWTGGTYSAQPLGVTAPR